jgi:hypothetical protein
MQIAKIDSSPATIVNPSRPSLRLPRDRNGRPSRGAATRLAARTSGLKRGQNSTRACARGRSGGAGQRGAEQGEAEHEEDDRQEDQQRPVDPAPAATAATAASATAAAIPGCRPRVHYETAQSRR